MRSGSLITTVWAKPKLKDVANPWILSQKRYWFWPLRGTCAPVSLSCVHLYRRLRSSSCYVVTALTNNRAVKPRYSNSSCWCSCNISSRKYFYRADQIWSAREDGHYLLVMPFTVMENAMLRFMAAHAARNLCWHRSPCLTARTSFSIKVTTKLSWALWPKAWSIAV